MIINRGATHSTILIEKNKWKGNIESTYEDTY